MNKVQYLLGIDIGTTTTKSILLQTDGKVLKKAGESYSTIYSKPLFAEQDSEDWWRALVKTVNEVLDCEIDTTIVKGISLSTQGGTLIPTDEKGVALCPAILWSDARCAKERELLLNNLAEEEIYNKTGWNLGNGLNLLQILWLKNNRPDIFNKAAYFLSVHDFISMRLTGRPAIDASNAGINQLMDINELKWDKKILNILGISEKQLPELVESGKIIGNLTETSAKALNLTCDTKVISGGHDQYCVALGAGALNNQDSIIGTGTAWVVTLIQDQPKNDSNLNFAISRHTVPNRWGKLLSLESGGETLEWFRKKITPCGSVPDYKTIDAECEKRGICAPQLLFYPYLTHCDFPYGTTKKMASFLGLSAAHDWYHMARSIMEGVAFQIVWMLEELAGNRLSSIKMTGGAVNSKLWTQMVADISGLPVQIPKVADVGCIGAAILAGVGTGVFTDCEQGYKIMDLPEEIVFPGENSGLYKEAFLIYKKLSGSTLNDR